MNTNFSNARSNFVKSISDVCKSIYPCLQKGLVEEIDCKRKQICKDLARDGRFTFELADDIILLQKEMPPGTDQKVINAEFRVSNTIQK